MTTMHEYVVLRLAPDQMRGEIINVGIALFSPGQAPRVLLMAPPAKLRALDTQWSTARLSAWGDGVRELLNAQRQVDEHVAVLASMGYCVPGEPGMFMVETQDELRQELNEIREMYVLPRGGDVAASVLAEPHTKLSIELRRQFRRMHKLGKSVDDLQGHLVVPNVPVPEYPDLKADFVFKNGVYRITQTLDYRVSAQGAHQKIAEACTKSMAADLAAKSWGSDTIRLAVVNVPEAVADVAAGHLNLLRDRGFQVFRADDQRELEQYHHMALGTENRDFALQMQRH